MRCAACSSDNPVGSKFCLACGNALGSTCAQCGAGVPAAARFCGQCGAPVTAAPRASSIAHGGGEGERRQLTLLFCDLVGSTELANRLDPEDWQSLGAEYHRAATVASKRFGGYVAKYLGDGVVVYFGFPQAHEDDAERGVRAGLAILEEMRSINAHLTPQNGLHLAVRIGVHTGEVVVAPGGGSDYEVFGDAPNLAARLQGAAAPDTVVISAATLRLVRGIFVTEDLGPQQLKGFPAPIPTFRVVRTSGVRSRLNMDAERLTPLVGRAAEMGILHERWQTARGGSGGAVLISGEAGIGKSRLVHALRDSLAEQAYTWLECRCTPYTQHSAFHPVIQLVEQALAIGPDDGPAEKIARLENALSSADFPLPETVPLFTTLLSIPLAGGYSPLLIPPERQRERTLEALVHWATVLSTLQPLLLLVEDAHWCDPSSMELFRQLIARSRNAQMFVLLAARPEFDPDWARTEGLTFVRLDRLGEAEAREIVNRLSPDGGLPDPVLRAIAQRADGNPLYLEELVHSMAESGRLREILDGYARTGEIADPAIPATLQDSLTARLDRLGAARDVAQRAAVLGREFSYSLAAATAGFDAIALQDGLARLIDAGLLFARGEPPHATYTFKHALIQEAAYHSLLRRTRQQLHARIAQTIVERFPTRADTEAEVVARHYEAAGLASDAATYYQRAGEGAAARSACEEACVHLRNGLRLLEGVTDASQRSARELALQLALGPPLVATRGFPDPETRAAYERALVLCDAGNGTSVTHLAAALGGLSICSTSAGDFERGIALAERLLEVRGDDGENSHLLLAHLQIAIPRFLQARFATALEHCERARRLYDPSRHAQSTIGIGVDHGVGAHVWSMWSLWFLGYADQAVRRGEAGIELARRLGHPHSLAVALLWKTILHYWRHEMTQTCENAAETIALSQEQGFSHWVGVAKAYRGAALVAQGAGPAALADVVDGLMQAARAHQGGAPFLFGMLAEAHQAVGAFDQAMAALEQGTAIASMTAQPLWDPEFLRLKAEIGLRAGSASEADAEALLRQAVQAALDMGARPLALRAATSLAHLLQRHGKAAAAAEILAPVHRGFVEGHATRDVIEAASLLEALATFSSNRSTDRRSPSTDGA